MTHKRVNKPTYSSLIHEEEEHLIHFSLEAQHIAHLYDQVEEIREVQTNLDAVERKLANRVAAVEEENSSLLRINADQQVAIDDLQDTVRQLEDQVRLLSDRI